MTTPDPFIRQPDSTSTHLNTLILLHGTSQSGNSFAENFLSIPFPFSTVNVDIKYTAWQLNNFWKKVGKYDEEVTPTIREIAARLAEEFQNLVDAGQAGFDHTKRLGGGQKFPIEWIDNKRGWKTATRKLERSPATSAEGYTGMRTLLQRFPNTKFIFPTGELKPTTVFEGRMSYAWFDVHKFSDRTIGEGDAVSGLRGSVAFIADLVKEEAKLLNGKGKVALLGFSQGAALAAIALLSGEIERIAGERSIGAVIGMSGWLPFKREIGEILTNSLFLGGEDKRRAVRGYVRKLLELELEPKTTKEEEGMHLYDLELFAYYDAFRLLMDHILILHSNTEIAWSNVPLWLGHGEEDEKVKQTWGEGMRDVMSDLEIEVRWKLFGDLQHWWNEEEMTDIAAFLESVWDQP